MITINNFKGISKSPLTGFGAVVNCNVTKGLIRQEIKSANASTAVGLVNWINNNYALDDSGKLYSGLPFGTNEIVNSTTGAGQGLFVYNGYTYVARATALDRLPVQSTNATGTISSVGTAVTGVGTLFTSELAVNDVLSPSGWSGTKIHATITAITDDTHLTVDSAYDPNLTSIAFGYRRWANAWQTLDTATWHPMLVGLNNILYIGNGSKIATVNSSGTFNGNALDLTAEYSINAIAELGKNLMIGTSSSASSKADIFPWDRVSTSFNIPLKVGSGGIFQLATKDNILYVNTNTGFYKSNGSSVGLISHHIDLFRNVADSGVNRSLPSKNFGSPIPGAIMVAGERILFGLNLAAAFSFETGYHPSGVWSYRPDDGQIVMESIPSNGVLNNTSSSNIIGAINGTDTLYNFSWQQGASYGLDYFRDNNISSNFFSKDYSAFFESPLYEVGLPLSKATFRELTFVLMQTLTTGQGLRIKYRKSLSDDWTTIGTFNFAALGAVSHHTTKALITDAVTLQIRVEFAASTNTYHTIQLKEITLK